MPIINITKSEVDSLERRPDYRPHRQTLYYDCTLRGFGVCVGPQPRNALRKPTKTYFAEGSPNGRTRRRTIGRHGLITTEQARREAKVLIGRMAADVDPKLVEQQEAEARRQAEETAKARGFTLRQGAELYLQAKRLAPSTLAAFNWGLEHHFADWLDRPLAGISRSDAFAKHKALSGSNGPYGANGAMRQFRAIYNLALKHHEHLPPVNPCIAVAWNEETPRDAAIPAEKLAEWYTGIGKLPNEIRRDYYEFVLFSGLRRVSAAVMRWEHVNFDKGTLFIPEPKGGKKRAFTLPLSDRLLAILNRRQTQNSILYPGSPWVWPSRSEEGHLMEPKLSPADLKLVTVPFSIHGLRHTYVTCANAAGVSSYDIKLLVNHAMPKGDVTAGYIASRGDHLQKSQQRITDYISGLVVISAK